LRGIGKDVNTTSQVDATCATDVTGSRPEIGADFDRGGIEIEHDHVVVGVADDVAAHGTAHVADADEADLHCRIPLAKC
jgi:hypothetical protein